MNKSQKKYLALPIIREAHNAIYDNKSNFLMAITGRVGVGKSHTAHFISMLWHIIHFKKAPFAIENIFVYSINEFLRKSLYTLTVKDKPITMDYINDIENMDVWLEHNREHISPTPGRVIIFDETGVGANVRDWYTKESKSLGKLLQLFRFLRLFCIFIIPEKISLADSNIGRFLNAEFRITKKLKDHVRGVCYEYIGWNEKKNLPIRKRIVGNTNKGYLLFKKLPEKETSEYDITSKGKKTVSLFGFAKDLDDKKSDIANKKSAISKDVQMVLANKEKFSNSRGFFDRDIIKAELGCTLTYALTLKKLAQKNMYV